MVDYKDFDKISYHAGFQDGYAEAKEIFKRPQGKWVKATSDSNYYEITCSECGHGFEYETQATNYCPNCGADMRGKEE